MLAQTLGHRQLLIAGGAIVVTLVALVLLIRAFWPARFRADPAPYDVLGQVLAEETIKLAGTGGQVLLIAPEGEEQYPLIARALRRFRKGIAKTADCQLVATETVAVGPLSDKPWVDANDLFGALERHRGVTALVIFGSPPQLLDQADQTRWQQQRPKVILACLSPAGTQPLINDRLVDLLIMPRTTVDATANPQTLREKFNRQYQVVMPTQQP